MQSLSAKLNGTWNDAIESALLRLPGGSYCDPQEAADEIRQLKKQPKQDSGDAVHGDSNGTTVAEQSNMHGIR